MSWLGDSLLGVMPEFESYHWEMQLPLAFPPLLNCQKIVLPKVKMLLIFVGNMRFRTFRKFWKLPQTLQLIFFYVLCSQWLVMRYAISNLEIMHAAVQIAKQEGLLISLDLASFEVIIYVKACSVHMALHFGYWYHLNLEGI